MTISSTTRKAGPFDGNGVTTSFPFTFKVFAKSDLEVVRTMPSGIEKTLVLDSDYSVTLNGDQDANPGGTITYPVSGTPLPTGWRLTAVGDIDNLQPTDITNGGGFYPQVIENALDRVTMLIQQLDEEVDRTIRIAVSDDSTEGLELPAQDGRATRILGFDADGNFTTYERATATVQTTYRQFTATAGQTVFSLPNTYTPGANSLYVWMNGAKLISGVDFSETTSTSFTLTTGAQAGDSIEAIAGVPLASGTVADSSQVSYTPAGAGAVGRTAQAKMREWVSVMDFGAIGDGTLHTVQEWVNSGRYASLAAVQADYPLVEALTDSIDQAAIQRAISTHANVNLPNGTYIVKPRSNKIMFDVPSGCNLKGTRASVIKVASSAGGYNVIFGQFSTGSPVVNASLSGFAIDQNVAGNINNEVALGNAKLAVGIFNFNGISIDGVTFIDACGINTVSLNGATSNKASVRNCDFFWKWGSSVSYDNSALYFNCDDHTADNNKFYGKVGESFGAIETHNGRSIISGNFSSGYATICNIVNTSAAPASGDASRIKVFGNVAEDCQLGIRLWSITDGVRLDGVSINNNDIYVAQIKWNTVTYGGIVFNLSTTKDGGSYVLGGITSNVSIRNNLIVFEREAAEGRSVTSNAQNAGIGICQVGDIENVSVKNNTIINSPSKGINATILVDGAYTNKLIAVQVNQNDIIDAGSNKLYLVTFRTGLFISGGMNVCDFSDNKIIDTGSTGPVGKYSLYLNDDANPSVKTRIGRQTVQTRSGKLYYLAVAMTGVYDITRPKTIITTDAYPPADGTTVYPGDIVLVTGAVTAGQPDSYICRVYGTFGTLTGVTATASPSSTNDVTISGASNITDLDAVLQIAGAGSGGAARVGVLEYLNGSDGVFSTSIVTAVTGAAVTYWAPLMSTLSVR